MISNWKLVAAMGLLVACNGGSDPESKGQYVDRDTADGGDEGATGGSTTDSCSVQVSELSPDSGSSDFYYRDTMSVTFDDAASELGPVATLTDASGGALNATLTFDDTGFKADITPDTLLSASTTYTLTVEICETSALTEFSTSAYGTPLSIDVAELAGNTYNFNLGGAEYTQPEGLGDVLAAFLDAPLLIGVGSADATSIQMLGTQGKEVEGAVVADDNFDTWDFGSAVLDGAYFQSAATDIELEYGCAVIPIYDFQLEGTFSADGSVIGGGSALGLGDSRDMGCLAGLGSDPAAICNLAATFGLACETCPDGNPWCLNIEGFFDPAEVLPGVSLTAP
jgi:hypothetical protein